MHYKLSSLAVTCLLVLVPACGDSKGQDETTQTDPGTTGPDPATDSAATDNTPTEGSATEGPGTEGPATDTGDPTTDGTTGGPGDPAIVELCSESFANGEKIVEAQCQCYVDQGEFPDVASCLEAFEGEGGTATDECICEVYSHFPQTKAGLECATPAQMMVLACLEGKSCAMGIDEVMACFNTYFDAIFMCEEPSKETVSQVAIQCEMIPPFVCGSGETIPESWKCDFSGDCSDGSDEAGCPGQFMCADGMGYIPESYKCNGEPECADGSDEAGCPKFKCESGPEIPEKFKCDGYPDCCGGDPECPDLSDEAGCPTFMCMNGNMIPLPFKCNGSFDCCMDVPDCMDESDEMDCPTFMCESGETIPENWACDGFPDCPDGSDEAMCG